MATTSNTRVNIPFRGPGDATGADTLAGQDMIKRAQDIAEQFRPQGVTDVSMQGKKGLALDLDQNSLKPKLEPMERSPDQQRADEANRKKFFDAAVLLVEANAKNSEDLAKAMKAIVKSLSEQRRADATNAVTKSKEAIALMPVLRALGIVVKVASVLVASLTLLAGIASTVASAGAAGPGAAAIVGLVLSGVGSVGSIVSATGAFDGLPPSHRGIAVAFDVTMVLVSLAGVGLGVTANYMSKAAAKALEKAARQGTEGALKETGKLASQEVSQNVSIEMVDLSKKSADRASKEVTQGAMIEMANIGEEAVDPLAANVVQDVSQEMAQALSSYKGIKPDLQDISRRMITVSTLFGGGQSLVNVGASVINAYAGTLRSDEKALLGSAALWEGKQKFTMEVTESVMEAAQSVMRTSLDIIEKRTKVFNSLSNNQMRARTV